MFLSLKAHWKNLRGHKWLSLTFDVLVIVAAFVMIHAWNTRNLPLNGPFPGLPSGLLNSTGTVIERPSQGVGVVYFFAPWCSYCRHSIGNLEKLVDAGDVSWARAIALDYSDLDELNDFVRATGISLPVLLGNNLTARDWNIRAFPTYFVIDSQGNIRGRSVGYSTRLGLWARVRLAR